MPRILITGFCALPGPNRAGVQLGHVVSALSQHHSVDVLVMRRGEQAYVVRNGDGRILRVPLTDGGARAQVEAFRRALRRQLESSEYDIVHFRDGWSGVPVLEMRPNLEYATVFDVTRSPMAEAPLIDLELGSELGRDEEACLLAADLVLVPSENARTFVGTRPERIHVVPPGVDVNLFDWDEPPPGPPIVLCAGDMQPGRGLRVLLRAMAYVVSQVEARLVIAGAMEPEFRAEISGAIQELGLEGRVEIRGEVEHAGMPALIARASVCVAPTATESRAQPMALYPTKLLEYMACRRAVVAPRRGSTTMLLGNGTHGLFFEPGDPLDLSRHIVKLLQDHDLRARLAEAGYQLVRQSHAASATRRALRKAYQTLLERVPSVQSGAEPVTTTVATDPNTSPVPSESLQLALAEAAEIADHTDEYEAPLFEPREYPGTATMTAAVDVAPGDITSVEQRAQPKLDQESWTDHTEISTRIPPAREVLATDSESEDDWIVAEWDKNSSEWHSLFDEDGAADNDPSTPEHLLENRFVAGELEVPDTPRRDLETELDEHTSFTAVSVLLGTMNDDTDGAGSGQPG